MMAKGCGIYDGLGGLVGMHDVMTDITRRKQALEGLQALAAPAMPPVPTHCRTARPATSLRMCRLR